MCYYCEMNGKTSSSPRIGYTRGEFNALFQIYSRNVYTGLFRDFRFSEYDGRYYISFCEEAGAIPLITIEKRRLGPDRVLFVATMPGPRGQLIEAARSEKIDHFVAQINDRIDRIREDRSPQGTKAGMA